MKKCLFLLILFCSTHILLMAQQNEDQIRQKINQTASSLKTMQCDFVQTKHIKMLDQDIVSKGRMFYQQTSRLRWEYTTPYAYIFILNADKVLLKNQQRNDLIDVNQNKMFKEIANIMMNSVVGNCLTDDKSFKSNISVAEEEWVTTLLPQRKDLKQIFQTIILHFSKKNSIVTKVELIEKNGDKTVIDLKNIKTNETINTNLFSIR